MDFKPAKKQLYAWVVTALIFGVIIFLSGFIPATLGKQMINLDAAALSIVDTFIMIFSIAVGGGFGLLMVLIYLYHGSVNYSLLNDRIVITMRFPAKKEKVIPYSEIMDVEEHQNPIEKMFGLMHLTMKTTGKQNFLDKLIWGWDTMPGIIIKEGIKKELLSRISKS